MKQLFFLITSCFILANFQVFAEEDVNCDCDESEERPCFKFRRLPDYENSVVRDPIEREPVISHPSNHESSFYEQMTR